MHMARKNAPKESRPLRITHAYGISLQWSKLPPRTRLTPETAMDLRAEGFTMVLAKTGWGKSRQVSLLRYADRLAPHEN